MKYKVIALDLDGTLTNSQKVVTPQTKAALFKAQEKGLRVLLASGRPVYGILPLAKELKLDQYGGFILAYNGASIINCQTWETFYQRTIPAEMVPVLVELAKKYGVDILTYKDKDILTNNKDNIYVQEEAFITKMPVVQLEDMTECSEYPLNKMMMLGEGDYLAEVEKKLRKDIHGMLAVYRSEVYFLEIMPKKIDKAYALSKLLDKLSLTTENLIACGDSYNDQSMVEMAGLGVAMENAKPELKAVADYITLSNDEDGIAKVLKEFV